VTTTESAPTSWVGQPLKRKEDARLLRGEGQFIGDITLPRMLHLHFVRSTQAHARLLSIDLSKALAVPGVVAGFTGRDLVGHGMREFLIPSVLPQLPGELRVPPSLPLPVDKVVFHGEPIAVLLAEDRYALDDASELVEVEYEPLPVVIDPEQGLEPGAARLYEDWPDNILYREKMGNDASEAFEQADVIVEERFSVPRTGCSPMEPRGAVADWSEHSGLTLRTTTQRPHILRLALSEVLDIPEHRVRVLVPKDQGGQFGTKAPFYREDVVIGLVAKAIRRPVRWMETREEHFRAGIGQERGQVHYLQVAAKRDGTILGIRDRCVGDVGDGKQGIYLGFVYPYLGCAYLPSLYNIPQVEIDLVCVATNKPSLTPSRAFGGLPTRFAMDRAVDLLAKELGLDPVEVRRQNLITEFPHLTPTMLFYDSGDYRGAFDKLVEMVDLNEVRRRQAELREQGRYLGVGFGVGVEISGVSSMVFVALENEPGFGAATVKVSPSGKVLVLHGDAPGGQSHETTVAQILADEFGLTPDDVMLEYGDTWTTPFGSGTVGNRMSSYTISAVVLAARELKKKMATVAAHDLGISAEPEEFTFAGGDIVLDKDPDSRIPFSAVARHLIMAPVNLPAGMDAGLEHTAYYEPAGDIPAMFGANFHAAVVEVHPESGEFEILRYVVIDDCGKPINPLVIEGQTQGGAIMGIGNAVFEEFVYDDQGVLQTTALTDYLMPSAADVPHVESRDHSVPTPHNVLGTKGKGEGTPGPVPGALANAIEDALAPFDVKLTELPLRPERIWRALQRAKGIDPDA
jgi:carbon-monoxide dehydrogenase large subunit